MGLRLGSEGQVNMVGFRAYGSSVNQLVRKGSGPIFPGPSHHGYLPSLFSSPHMLKEMDICLWLLTHCMFLARVFAAASAGNNIAARIAMMAITTSNSISVKANIRFRTKHFQSLVIKMPTVARQ